MGVDPVAPPLISEDYVTNQLITRPLPHPSTEMGGALFRASGRPHLVEILAIFFLKLPRCSFKIHPMKVEQKKSNKKKSACDCDSAAEPPSLNLLEVEHVAVEVREDVSLECRLLAVGGKVLRADGAHLPVGLQVALEAALLKVRREDDLAEWAAPLGLAAPGGEG